MVDVKRYTPSNKRFQKHTQHFVEGTTMKGHLDEGKDKNKEKNKYKGNLIRVVIAKLYENGWEVKKDNKTYYCNYGDNIIYLPPHTTTDLYYIPNGKCEVEFTVDEKSGIKTITRINHPKKQPISMNNQGVTIQGSGAASIKISEDTTEVEGELIAQDLTAKDDIIVDTTEQEGLPNKISVTSLYKQVQKLEKQVSDNNGGS